MEYNGLIMLILSVILYNTNMPYKILCNFLTKIDIIFLLICFFVKEYSGTIFVIDQVELLTYLWSRVILITFIILAVNNSLNNVKKFPLYCNNLFLKNLALNFSCLKAIHAFSYTFIELLLGYFKMFNLLVNNFGKKNNLLKIKLFFLQFGTIFLIDS